MATYTIYPSVDGNMDNYTGSAYTSWANLIADGGQRVDKTSANAEIVGFESTSTTNYWLYLYRGGYIFDTSSIDDGETINSATFSLYGTSKADTGSFAQTVCLYSFAPASNTDIVAGDFDSLGTTMLCTSGIDYSSWSTSGYNDFSLNATGLAAISKTGYTRLGTRFSSDASASSPTWSGTKYTNLKAYYSEQSGTTNDPKFVINTSAASAFVPYTRMF
jgi:hypothetical protein